MTADNADGGEVPPTTHFAIRACCLICAHGRPDVGEDCAGDELCITNDCDDFKLRDFGYPVRTVDVG